MRLEGRVVPLQDFRMRSVHRRHLPLVRHRPAHVRTRQL